MRFVFIIFLFVFGGCNNASKYAKNYFDSNEYQTFILSVVNKNFDKADELLDEGIDINKIGSGGVSPFHWFLLNDNFLDTEIFTYLLQRSPDVEKMSPKLQLTPFHESALRQDTQYLRYFLAELKINPDLISDHSRRPTALFFAVSDWNYAAIELLINSGADVNWLNDYGENALVETSANNWRSAYMLLEAGIDPNNTHSPSGKTIVWSLENNNYYKSSDRIDWRQRVVDFLENSGIHVSPWQPPAE